ncbi:MAG: flagellar motor stator protein MotA [Candidatus Eisenbacteria bacterium]|uniref:Flagellar motor stator protein MotA n=1 Tax=Eiseniibacteriota bacterium TaxID=2212470 RepID=A0A933SED7_UNCEI|nr:flagellar motor stator protein MotA [Candidatus Eisenbacteria bacterium]
MLTIVGLVVVIGSVLGGFMIAGGNPAALMQISEIISIVGTSVGTVLISTPAPVLKATASKLQAVVKPSPFNKKLYLDSLKLLYELFQTARKDGLVAIEGHIEKPKESALFKKYPAVLHEHHAMEFLCDSLRLVLVGSVPPHDLEGLMDSEIDTHHEAEGKTVGVLQKVGDALPGIGIVAAVAGIIVTMGAIAGPIEEIGHHVGAALTGTFMGVLFAYGFLNPLATSIEHVNSAEARYYHFLKAAVVSFAKGFSPIVAAEFARRAIFADDRPSFAEMEGAVKGQKAA